ncbi:MAG: ATP-binding protein, partial [Rikenellaceae bacterium]
EELKREKDKLILHFSHSTVGIAFFSPQGKSIYSNTLFVTYLNTIAETPTIKIEDFFTMPEFAKFTEYIAKNSRGVLEDKISRNGQYFIIRVIIFEDRSIEVVLNNITEIEKTRILKQEMTSNIAHELRTPVSSISGYMETLIDQKDLSPEKRHYFLERAYIQVQRLSELIRDISIITRIEEGQAEVEHEKINISTMVKEALIELKPKIEKNGDKIENKIPDNLLVSGNSTLIYSIFRNLVDNAINYAGEKITIRLDKFFEDENFYYFSVSDSGKGIPEEHLTKIFDRFYRISEGRTRQDGGSGLGLSIVKNAILFHGGTVSAKNRKEGGLEIIFSIKK